jgi:hypothetical protein
VGSAQLLLLLLMLLLQQLQLLLLLRQGDAVLLLLDAGRGCCRCSLPLQGADCDGRCRRPLVLGR